MSAPDEIVALIRPRYEANRRRREAISAAQAKANELRAQFERDAAARERLREEETQQEALRLIEGDDAASSNPRREAKLAKLDKQAPAQLAAMTLQDAKVAEAQKANPEAETAFCTSVLNGAATIRSAGFDQIKAILPQLVAPMEQILAADHLIRRLIGESFPVPTGAARPVSGITLIRRFMKALPDQMRPDDFNEGAVFAGANEIANAIINQVKDEQQ